MFEIKGRRIRLTRGDTAQIVIEADGLAFTDADRAVLAVKREADDRPALLEKTATPDENGVCVFRLENEDSEDIEPGAYTWDVRFVIGAVLDTDGRVTGGRQVITPFEPSEFTILGAVADV